MSCTIDILRDMGYAPRAEIMGNIERVMLEVAAEQKRHAVVVDNSYEPSYMHEEYTYEESCERLTQRLESLKKKEEEEQPIKEVIRLEKQIDKMQATIKKHHLERFFKQK